MALHHDFDDDYEVERKSNYSVKLCPIFIFQNLHKVQT